MRRAVSGLVVVAVSSFALVSANQATAAPAEGHDQERAKKSATRVVIAPKMVKKLRRANIDVRALKPAKATKFKGHPAARLPIAKKNKRVVKHRGGLAFVKNKKRATAKRFWGNYKKGRVTAAINGSKRKTVFLPRKSPRPNLGNVRLVLTRYTAGAMNDTFNTKRFKTGDTFGYAMMRR